jgi:hypothetical protein
MLRRAYLKVVIVAHLSHHEVNSLELRKSEDECSGVIQDFSNYFSANTASHATRTKLSPCENFETCNSIFVR